MMTLRAIRRPTVAGYYYPADPETLRRTIEMLTRTEASPVSARAVLVPHGSYHHAGGVAGAALARVAIPRRCIIAGPSHTGSWMSWSVMVGGAYRTPLGDVPIDEACAEALRRRCPFLEADGWSQRGEHAIEVVLPFLQQLGPPDLTIVPVIIGSDDRTEQSRFAEALAQVVRMQEEPVLLIASSDLSHYRSQAEGAAQDRELIQAITALDSNALIRSVNDHAILMCGYAAACVLDAGKALGAACASLIKYGTSAEAGGDPGSAIGYAGIVID